MTLNQLIELIGRQWAVCCLMSLLHEGYPLRDRLNASRWIKAAVPVVICPECSTFILQAPHRQRAGWFSILCWFRTPSTFVFCVCHCFLISSCLPHLPLLSLFYFSSFLPPYVPTIHSCFLPVDCLVTHTLIVLHPETTRSYWGRQYIDERWYMDENQFFKVTWMVNGWIRTRTTSAWLLVWREPKRGEYLEWSELEVKSSTYRALLY